MSFWEIVLKRNPGSFPEEEYKDKKRKSLLRLQPMSRKEKGKEDLPNGSQRSLSHHSTTIEGTYPNSNATCIAHDYPDRRNAQRPPTATTNSTIEGEEEILLPMQALKRPNALKRDPRT